MEARSAQLKFEQLSGELCKTSDVENVAKQMGRLTKESLLTLADRLSPVLTGITDIDEIHEILTKEINTALRNLSIDNFDFFKGDHDGIS
jgi:phage terminase Nu1 subunit (DNA packaging protein)